MVSTFDLVENWDQLKLPSDRQWQNPRGRPAPSPLLAAADGRIRSQRRVATALLLRDTFSVRAHGIVKDDTLIAAAMGHTVEVHHRSYRTHEWRSVRKAYAQAGENHLRHCSKRQQQSAELEQLV